MNRAKSIALAIKEWDKRFHLLSTMIDTEGLDWETYTRSAQTPKDYEKLKSGVPDWSMVPISKVRWLIGSDDVKELEADGLKLSELANAYQLKQAWIECRANAIESGKQP